MATWLIVGLVGLLTGGACGRFATIRRARRSELVHRGQVHRLLRVIELASRAEDAFTVVAAAQAELSALLHLRDCHFEAPPFVHALERLESSGSVSWRHYRLTEHGFALPEGGAELPVTAHGRTLGRFVLEPEPNSGVSLDQRLIAVAIANQVGLALAAPQPGRETPHG